MSNVIVANSQPEDANTMTSRTGQVRRTVIQSAMSFFIYSMSLTIKHLHA